MSCKLDNAEVNFCEEALLHRRSLSSGGDEAASLVPLAMRPVQGFVKEGFEGLLGKHGREARAFMMVCRGMQSVDSDGDPEIDFWRKRRVVKEGSDQPAVSSWGSPFLGVGSIPLPGACGAGSCEEIALCVWEGSI